MVRKMMSKYLLSAIVAIPFSWLAETLRYVYQDWEFAKWIALAVVLDTILGLVKAWMKKDISSEEFWQKFSKKIFAYICLLILSNIMQNYTVNGSNVGATEWVGSYLCTFMLVREAISILENVNAITPIVPKWVLDRMRDFTEKEGNSEE
jgi:toxin secretion/phage lysis holin